MKRLWRETLIGAAIGTAWMIASRFLPARLYLGVTTSALVLVILWALRTLGELRVQKRELEDHMRQLEELRRKVERDPGLTLGRWPFDREVLREEQDEPGASRENPLR